MKYFFKIKEIKAKGAYMTSKKRMKPILPQDILNKGKFENE